MKVNAKLLHIPPYISTTWDQIRALSLREQILVVSLKDGSDVQIPNLMPELINAIYAAHEEYLEAKQNRLEQGHAPIAFPSGLMAQNPEKALFRFGIENLEGMQMAMQHNPAQSNGPNLPEDVVNKLSMIGKIIPPEEMQGMPKPEPHCNCLYCQITRAIRGEPAETHALQQAEEVVSEEEIKDEDLKFQDWEIIPSGEKLYTVTNKLDQHESYTVYLGEPVGCTCGKQGCEHILAVLKS